jgi:hypothetical protein
MRDWAQAREAGAATMAVVDSLDAMFSARFKVELLAEGLRVSPAAADFLAENGKPPLRVRSGSCGGLDLVLPGDIYANCPVDEVFARDSRLSLENGDDALYIVDSRDGVTTPVNVLPRPDYYGQTSSAGNVPLSRLGQLCSDRLGIGLTNGCVYWAKADTRCRFCSIGLNVRTGHEIGRKLEADVVEVVSAALDDAVIRPAHVLLGGGTPAGPDAGALAIAEATRSIKQRWPDLLVYAMVAPPERAEFVDALVDAGADEVGINLEVWSDEAGERYLPGKWGNGRARCLQMLAAAVDAFHRRGAAASAYPPGVGRVRSIMMVGLESREDTLTGVDALASLGVMPILTPFRPMRGTEMERHPRWSGPALWDITERATDVAGAYGLPLGPTCVPCQSNTLNVPGHSAYRAY